ncbi:MAG: hypothetical protein QOH76_3942 [Thermoleophilaceae bacterium]|nr:hypothetical protein [Thermoleophilaceae bacterium]
MRFADLHGPDASSEEVAAAAALLRKQELDPDTALFRLWAVPTIELVESQLLEAHEAKRTEGVWDYYVWVERGADLAELWQLWGLVTEGKRTEFEGEAPEDWWRIVDLAFLYVSGRVIDPLIAAPMRLELASGVPALYVADGRHRVLAAGLAHLEEMRVFVQFA